MTPTLTRLDRLRIERAVWSIDGRLQDLPRPSRVAKRRELRANLSAAAADVGSAEAVRRLGHPRKLAAEFLAAEYGPWRPHPSWTSALVFLVVAQVVLRLVLDTATSAFAAGALAGDPQLTGTVGWHGLALIFDQVTFTFQDGALASAGAVTGGAWTPAVYVGYLAGVVLAGRLWRLVPAWRRRPGATTHDE